MIRRRNLNAAKIALALPIPRQDAEATQVAALEVAREVLQPHRSEPQTTRESRIG